MKKTFVNMELYANPEEMYDYERSIKFYDNGRVEFLDYSGQIVHGIAEGKYEIEKLNRHTRFKFTDMKLGHPYDAYDAQTGHQSRRHPATPFRDIFCGTILP